MGVRLHWKQKAIFSLAICNFLLAFVLGDVFASATLRTTFVVVIGGALAAGDLRVALVVVLVARGGLPRLLARGKVSRHKTL